MRGGVLLVQATTTVATSLQCAALHLMPVEPTRGISLPPALAKTHHHHHPIVIAKRVGAAIATTTMVDAIASAIASAMATTIVVTTTPG